MSSSQDAIYNWLSIRVVVDARPDDNAACETEAWFATSLTEEHHISNVKYVKEDERYFVTYMQNGQTKQMKFPADMIDMMINQIEKFPERFENYPE